MEFPPFQESTMKRSRSSQLPCPARSLAGILLGSACLPSLAEAQSFADELREHQVVCSVLWRTKVGTKDRMTTASQSEASNFQLEAQVAYAPLENDTDRSPIYRLFHSGVGDHMLSAVTNEAPGYALEASVAFPWKAADAPAGTARLLRGWNSSLQDHAPMVAGLELPGYISQFFGGHWAFPRYDSKLLERETITGSEISLSSNLIAGGAIDSWTWNGKQFVNDLDYGRLIQSSLNVLGTGALPTEGGDKLGPQNYGDNRYWHGSPLLLHETESGPGGEIQRTRCAPLEWHMDDFGDGSLDRAVVYRDWVLGKNVVLDDPEIDLGAAFAHLEPQIARYETVFSPSLDLPNALIEVPTGYLEPEFNRYFTIDATEPDLNQALDEITAPDFLEKNPPNHYQFNNPGAGGVVLATSNLQYAMGVYGVHPDLGGSASFFTLFDFEPSTTKWAANYGPAPLVVGEHVFTTYIITGTLDDVRVAMRTLYTEGYGFELCLPGCDDPQPVGTTYGTGTPGSLGIPTMLASSTLQVGSTLDFLAGNMPPGVLCGLGLSLGSTQPGLNLGDGLLVQLGLPVPLVEFFVTGAAGEVPFPLPIKPNFSGLTFHAQAFALDGVGGATFASSAGLSVSVP